MKRLIEAFFNSLRGLRFGLLWEPALRQEMAVLAVSLPVALLITTDPWKLVAMWGTLLILLSVEFLNTGIEKLADRVTRENDDLIRIAKDCGSAGVLMAMLVAGAVWALALYERLTA